MKLALLILALTMGCSRGARNATSYDGRNVTLPCIFVPDGKEHWAMAGCSGMGRAGSAEAMLHFNSMGLRDKEYPARPGPKTVRILILGSSNMLGLGVEEKNTFPRILEKDLRSRGIAAEVINASVVGYCAIQSTFRFRELLERYSPHLVLYQWVQGVCPLFDAAWAERTEWKNGQPIRIDRSFTRGRFPTLDTFVFAHPQIFFLWLTLADQWRKAAFTWKIKAFSREENRPDAVLAPSLPYLRYLQNESRQHQAKFAIFSHHMKPFYQSIPSQFYYLLAIYLSNLLVPFGFMDDMAVVRAAQKNNFETLMPDFDVVNYRIPGDEHLSPEGNQKLAVLMGSLLSERRALLSPKN